MIPLLAALLLGANAQATGQMSPTSDVSANRVRATGAGASRALRDHVRTLPDVDWGAIGVGSALVTAPKMDGTTGSQALNLRFSDLKTGFDGVNATSVEHGARLDALDATSTAHGSRLSLLEIGDVPYITSGATTARPDRERWSDVVNVKDFGGDPTGVRDSTDAVQAAVNALISRGGDMGTLVLDGTYLVTTIVVSAHSDFTIDGRGGTLASYSTGARNAILDLVNVNRLRIRNLTVHCNYNASTTAGIRVSASVGAQNLDFSGITFWGCRRAYQFGDGIPANIEKPVSEVVVRGGHYFGVPTVVEANGTETVISVIGSQMTAQHAGWPDTTLPSYCVTSRAATVHVTGGHCFHQTAGQGGAFSIEPVVSAVDGNNYGQVYVHGALIEPAGYIGRAWDPSSVITTVAGRGVLSFEGCNGYHGLDVDAAILADANFSGQIKVSGSNFYARAPQRTQPNVKVNGAAMIVADDHSFNENYRKVANGTAFVGGSFRQIGPTQAGVIYALHVSPQISGDRGDVSLTLTVGLDEQVQRFATSLTANRAVTLSTSGALNGDTFRIVRTGLGAFTIDVGGLKTIPSATAAYVDVTYDGTAWRLSGYGAL